MKQLLISLTAVALLALPVWVEAQPTPIPPEAARETPLDPLGRQDIESPMRDREREPARAQPRPSRDPEGPRGLVQVQEELRKQGYDPGPIDGRIGPRTRQAIRSFQRDRGLPATGRLDETTRNELTRGAGRRASPR